MCASAPYGFIASPRSIARLDWDFPPIPVVPYSTGFPLRGHTPSPDIALRSMPHPIAAKRNEGRCREGGSSTAPEGRARSKRPARRGDGGQTDRDHRGARGRSVEPREGSTPCRPCRERRRLHTGNTPRRRLRVRRFISPTAGRRSLPLALRCGAAPPFRVENGSRDVASRP